MPQAIVTYIPVLHQGYRQLFTKHPEARELFLFGDEVIASYEHLVKDIRKLDPRLVQKAIQAWGIFDRVETLNQATIGELQERRASLVISDDDITNELVQKYFSTHTIERDTIFLRWDKKTSVEPQQISPDVRLSSAEFDKQMITAAQAIGATGHDWWRRIGAVLVRDGQILLQVRNEYAANQHIAYDQGDPRSNFKSGLHLESSLAIHAEAHLVALAARDGIPLKGADVYSETFPCPPCAKQLAYAGIRRLYYRTGYKVLDGESILKGQGVEIVFVK